MICSCGKGNCDVHSDHFMHFLHKSYFSPCLDSYVRKKANLNLHFGIPKVTKK